MTLSDFGICLEIFGFIILIFTSNRVDPTKSYLMAKKGPEDKFEKFREKIIPFSYVHLLFIFGIILLIIGLVLQLSHFD